MAKEKIFLIAHVNGNGKKHGSAPAQSAISAPTEKSALQFFGKVFPERKVTAVGIKGVEG